MREDGLVFFRAGTLKSGKFKEYWITPEKWFEIVARERRCAASWAARNPEKVKLKHLAFRARRQASGIAKPVLKRVIDSCRTRISQALTLKKNGTLVYLGCSTDELRVHLESKFVNGMSWENYGVRGWHVDHVIPLSSACSIEELMPLLHYSNLQPLWWMDNLLKGGRVGT